MQPALSLDVCREIPGSQYARENFSKRTAAGAQVPKSNPKKLTGSWVDFRGC